MKNFYLNDIFYFIHNKLLNKVLLKLLKIEYFFIRWD
jgi:hypothetical protein